MPEHLPRIEIIRAVCNIVSLTPMSQFLLKSHEHYSIVDFKISLPVAYITVI